MKKIEITGQAWLQELDPDKYYVMMFKGYPDHIKWDNKPANVSDILLNADRYTLQDIEKLRSHPDLNSASGHTTAAMPDSNFKGEQK